MLKRDGRYYLTYSAAGTENRTYAMGAYVGKSPLGPFTAAEEQPDPADDDGPGHGHGARVRGEGARHRCGRSTRWRRAWCTGSSGGWDGRRRVRRHGELPVTRASSMPQWLPAAAGGRGRRHGVAAPERRGADGRLVDAPNLSGRLAVDDDLRTWWQPAEDDTAPTLTSRLYDPRRRSAPSGSRGGTSGWTRTAACRPVRSATGWSSRRPRDKWRR